MNKKENELKERENAVEVTNQSCKDRAEKIKNKEKELRALEINLESKRESINQYIEDEAYMIYLQSKNVLDQREADLDKEVENRLLERLEEEREAIDSENEEKRLKAQNEADEIISNAEKSKRKADWLWGKCFILVLIALLFLGLNQGCDRIQRSQVKNAKAEVKKITAEMEKQQEKLKDIYICNEDYVTVQRLDGSNAWIFSDTIARVYKENNGIVYIQTDLGNYKISKDKLLSKFAKVDISAVL